MVQRARRLVKIGTYVVCEWISWLEQANAMSTYCEGVIVDNAILKIVEKDKQNCVKSVADFVRKIKILS